MNALVGGKVDGCIIWEPWGTQMLERLGAQGVKISGRDFYDFQGLLVVSAEMLEKRPGVAAKVLRALIHAEAYLGAHEEEAIDIIAAGAGYPRSFAVRAWGDFRHHVHLSPRAVRLMEENFVLIKRHDENFEEAATPDFRSFFEPAVLRQVAPERIDPQF